MRDFRNSVAERFIRYTQYDTMSCPAKVGERRPSTPGQEVLQGVLADELRALGLEVSYGPEKVVRGFLPGNVPNAPCVGFMAHVDTADDVMGNGVKARKFTYGGGDIPLEGGVVIKASENPELSKLVGTEIITSDGTTLLGADDKAGVAEIMEALVHYTSNPDIPRCPIEVFFTPDEETGAGMDQFPYHEQRSVVCYTMDGGAEGEIETECFNAATATIKISGVSAHLGSAKNKLVNALRVASAISSALPQAESPESTEKREGYYHVGEISGTNVECEMNVYIRDFDAASFDKRIANLKALAETLGEIYHAKIQFSAPVSYRNMAEANAKRPEALEAVLEAGKELGIDLVQVPIRGGTDGARMAEKAGVPCPNLFTGGHNYHSLEEWASVEVMSEAVNMILAIVKRYSEAKA